MAPVKVLITDDRQDSLPVAGSEPAMRLFHDHLLRNGSEAGHLPMTWERMWNEVDLPLCRSSFLETLEQ
jgi:hypothetical protein